MALLIQALVDDPILTVVASTVMVTADGYEELTQPLTALRLCREVPVGPAMKVIVLTTGGTIGHRSKDGVAVMDFDPAALVSAIGLPDVEIEFQSVFRKGSMDIVPDDWTAIASATAEAMARAPRGVVILHGTDTIHYTASALAFMLRDLSVPVVMTGSMIPGGDSGSDALPNLRDAIVVAARANFAEVCVVSRRMRKEPKGSSFVAVARGKFIPTPSTPLSASTCRPSAPSPAAQWCEPA